MENTQKAYDAGHTSWAEGYAIAYHAYVDAARAKLFTPNTDASVAFVRGFNNAQQGKS